MHGTTAVYESLGVRALDHLGRDVRVAVRTLHRQPAFTAVMASIIALSVAVAAVLFAVWDGVLLRALPYGQPDRLLRVFDSAVEAQRFPLTIDRFLEFRDAARTLDGLALYTGRDVDLSGNGREPTRLTGVAITSDYFRLLGRAPATGRDFIEADLRRTARVAILSDRAWRARFAADRHIVGKVVTLDREPWMIIGVMPPGFEHVGGAYRSPPQGDTVDIWLPLPLDPPDEMSRHSAHYCNAVGRIRASHSADEVQAELAALATGYTRRSPELGTWSVSVAPLIDEVTVGSRPLLRLLALATSLLLLVACANVAGLCLARAIARERDAMVREALGANRWQRLRVALAENLLLAVLGDSAGLVLAAWVVPLARTWLPEQFPRLHEFTFTVRSGVVGFAVGCGAVLIATIIGPGRTLVVPTGARVTADRRMRRRRTWLVVLEIALAGILCAGSVQAWRQYRAYVTQDPGFRPEGVLTFRVTLPVPLSSERGALATQIEALRRAIVSVDRVRAAGAATSLPWSGHDENTGLTVVGRDDPEDAGASVRYHAVTADYFRAMSMRLRSGRDFDTVQDREERPLVVVLNQAAASRHFPKGSVLGRVVRVFGADRQVVGVIDDVRDHPSRAEAVPAVWLPLQQVEFAAVYFSVQVNGIEPTALLPAVQAAIRRVDAALPLADVQAMETRVSRALATERLALRLFQAFTACTLALVASGLYGLLTYVVHQRRKELGIRAAIGATPLDLAHLVLRDSGAMAVSGVALCLVLLPLASAGWLGSLAGGAVLDAWTWIVAPSIVLVVCLLASLGPAYAASLQANAFALRED